MAFKLRRGTDLQRLSITPAEGELIYTTDTKMVYVGDGSTIGGLNVTDGIAAGIGSVIEDTNPQLGASLDVNSFNIEGTGNIDINGNVTANNIVSDNIYPETTPNSTLTLHGNGTGYVETSKAFKLVVYADAAARNAAIAVPIAGMIVFVTDSDGVGTPAFMGYNGSAWVALS